MLLDTNNLDPSSLVHGSYSWDKSSHTVQSFIIIFIIALQVNKSLALLLSCFRVCEDGSMYCLVRPLEYMDNMGENILNELEWPLLTLTDIVYCIPSGIQFLLFMNVPTLVFFCQAWLQEDLNMKL